MNFTIGQNVEITTKFRSNLLGKDFDLDTYVGKVVPNPKWLDNDYVSVHTGNPEYPTSYIHKNYIVGYKHSEKRSVQRIFEVKSKSTGKKYTVMSENGNVQCDCIGFQFRRHCKHSAKVKELLSKNNG